MIRSFMVRSLQECGKLSTKVQLQGTKATQLPQSKKQVTLFNLADFDDLYLTCFP